MESLPVFKVATFDQASSFRRRQGNQYSLLPFRFLGLDEDRYVLTNMVGEHIVVSFEELESLVRHSLSNDTRLYDDLKAKHVIADSDSQIAMELLACKFRTRHSQLADLTSLFLFVVTLRCEHSCPYCQVSRQSTDKKSFDMSQADASHAINIALSSPSPHIKIEFQGGEPLLNFDLIRWIVNATLERNRQVGKQIDFVIATNLALISDDILEFCRIHRIFISTSLDGPAALHNSNRPRPDANSFELAVQGIQRTRNALGHDAVSALMTTTRASLSQAKSIVDTYVELGFSSIFIRSLSPFGFAVKTGAIGKYTTDEWLRFYFETLEYILELNRNGVSFREEYASILLRKILTPFPTGYVDLQSPAGMGLGCLAFNYNGWIYPSDEARMLSEMSDETFRMGHVSNSSLTDLLTSDRYLNWITSSMTEVSPICNECGLMPYCGSDPVYHHATQGDFIGYKPLSGFCRKNMEILKQLIRILEDDQEKGAILRSWI